MGSLEDMRKVGLYLNDLNLFDNSRDMVMSGWHHASQLEFLVEQVRTPLIVKVGLLHHSVYLKVVFDFGPFQSSFVFFLAKNDRCGSNKRYV